MTITGHVLSAIEKTLLKTPAVYRYNEVLLQTFLATRGVHSWRQEDVFSKEPVRKMAIAMSSNQAYLGSNRTTLFHYHKFGLSQIVIYLNGLPIVRTPKTTNFEIRLYINKLEALDFLDRGGHGMSLSDYQNQFVMAFDLTSTQEASHDFIHPELTNSSVSVELTFARALADHIEILFLGERSSTFFVTSHRKAKKTLLLPTLLMDSNEIVSRINKCPHLKFKFRGLFAADLFPILKSNCFIIVNASDSSKPGSHWIFLYYLDNKMYIADPLGISVTNYRAIYERLTRYYQQMQELNANFPLQQRNSEFCLVFCIYFAHVIYTKGFKLNFYMNDNDLLRFATHML